jgi:cyclase
METMLRNGADKIGINTAAVATPELVTQGAEVFGKQCMVLSIEAKKVGSGKWECYTDNGRERSGLDAVQWAIRGEELGAGEILVTSVDNDGTRAGFDEDLMLSIRRSVSVPVIASGGAGKPADVIRLYGQSNPSGVCVASMLHYGLADIVGLKSALADEGIKVRRTLEGKS